MLFGSETKRERKGLGENMDSTLEINRLAQPVTAATLTDEQASPPVAYAPVIEAASNLSRLLLVSEPGKDGVFDQVAGIIDYLHRRRPDIAVDFAYSSRRSCARLADVVEAVVARGGEAVDLEVSCMPGPSDAKAAWKILELVRRRRPQIVHGHSSKAGALVRMLSLVAPGFPPVIYTPHAYYGLNGKRSVTSFVFNTIESLFGRIGRTVCSSSDERKFGLQQLRLPPRNLLVINNGIDVNRFHPATLEEKRACRAEFDLPEKGTILVSVGRDSQQKNYRPLYAALDPFLADPAGDCFFAHAGAGSVELGLTLSPEARKRFRGFTHIDAVERLLRAADGFILTSQYEGLSLGMLQALATGLKMFLTKVTGNRCLIGAGFNQVSWIELHDGEPSMIESIRKQVQDWLVQPQATDAYQVRRARLNYNSQLQYAKLLRLYGAAL